MIGLALLAACTRDGGDTGVELSITAKEHARVTANGAPLQLTLYQNEGRRCGRRGQFSFLVIEREANEEAPLWVFLHGGGVGYYDDAGYHPPDEESYNDAEDLASLQREVQHVVGEDWSKDTAMARAISQGWRVLVPSLCDHDMYLGIGQDYPGNPGEQVEGLLATEEALRFVEEGSATVPARPTSRVVLMGMSAGAVGAHALAMRREEAERPVGAVLLDSLLWSRARQDLADSGCTPQQRAEPDFDWGAVGEKLGPFLEDPALYPEAVVGSSVSPRFNLYALNDPACCGDRELLSQATGYASNCAWAYAGFDENAAFPNDYYRYEGQEHGLMAEEGEWQSRVEAWLYAVL